MPAIDPASADDGPVDDERGSAEGGAASVPDAAEGAGRRLSWRVATVIGIAEETPRVKTITLDIDGWPAPPHGHLPGQRVDIRLTGEDGYQAQRSYSIASAPEAPRVALTVERIDDGEVSPYLTGDLQAGDRFELRGPIGGYFVWTVAHGGPLVLIAGGSGIAPFMAMLRHRAAAHDAAARDAAARDVTANGVTANGVATGDRAGAALLLYSSRAAEDIIYREELDRLAARGDGLRVVHTLTRSQPAGWTGPRRRIDRAMLAELLPPASSHPRIFVCGSNGLVESAAGALVSLGYEAGAIRTERFGPSG
jgi:ferredoxin-NADP reductase